MLWAISYEPYGYQKKSQEKISFPEFSLPIRSFIFYLIENYKVSSENPEKLRIKKAEKHLSFFIDAYFDKRNRKQFWGNKNEIQADQWVYKCSNLPHQPATDLVVTINVAGNLHVSKLNFLFI